MIQKDEQEQRQQCKITKRSQIIDEVKQKKTEVIDKDLLKFKQLFDERNYEEALLEIEEKIKQNELLKENKKNNDELLMHKSIVLIQLDKYDEFLECINQAITLNPKNEKLLYHKGITLVKLDQYQQAFQCFDEAIKINPDNQASLIYLGITLEGIYNYNGAYKCYNEAQKYDQNFQLLNILKASTLFSIQQYKQKQQVENMMKLLNCVINHFRILIWINLLILPKEGHY
ncbi:unnamed protein product [Paramecium primaurelia]|uniref:Tetratricopeptide repeat protein n=1 Tax=Paramecium primaurelia TaxID=5886 RepID=A0A8S1QDQ9_PARPR|nr:unnamed protein product [Paramecium primaurelia]